MNLAIDPNNKQSIYEEYGEGDLEEGCVYQNNLLFENGSSYSGFVKDGLRHGPGT